MRITRTFPTVLLAFLMLSAPVVSSAAIVLSIGIAPPPLPIYDQPLCPGEGYIWTPGYWAYDDADGYFWVPGTWVLIPEPGYLWTPGYWGWGDGVFSFHEGYWGLQVGFYGGIDYGFGYIGVGYEGGYWNNGAFFYNRSVNNVQNVTNVYNKTVVVNNVTVSYNGGTGGVAARPTPQEQAAANQRHIPPTAAQSAHVQAASSNRQLFESVNHGKPAIAATAKPSEFNSGNVVAAKAAAPSYQPPSARSAPGHAGTPAPQTENSRAPVHPNDLPSTSRSVAPKSGDPDLDQKLQQEQQSLNAKQDQERQQLQQQQEQEHRQTAPSQDQAAQQQLEQKHQQQTQQLAQKHANEQQDLHQRQRQTIKQAPPSKDKH
jgi:hypothetical protein